MKLDDIPEQPYQRKGEPDSPQVRRRYWDTAFGLQEVDGLAPSDYARSLADRNVEGALTLAEVGTQLRGYYRANGDHGHDGAAASREPLTGEPEGASNLTDRTSEADLVSHRIVEMLEDGSFILSPGFLSTIHRRLFADLDPATYRPGEFKTEQLIKPEIVLNGDSVFYAPPEMYDAMLRMLFARESQYEYGYDFSPVDCTNFSTFIARVWQIHPFFEGNTRTVAVFSELYLRDLGFDVNNRAFEKHAGYFRDALVRANYRNRKVHVEFDLSFLEAFFRHAVLGESHELTRDKLMCREMFEHPKALRNATQADALAVRRYLAEMER